MTAGAEGGGAQGRLLADIGGTNARFAYGTAEGAITAFEQCRVADFPTFEAALETWLSGAGAGFRPRWAAIAAAGPVIEGEVKLTNAPWRLRAADISDCLGGAKVSLFNDLEAVGHALPHLSADDVVAVASAMPPPGAARRLAVNVGTGFGAAVAIPLKSGGWTVCSSEAGHMTLGAGTGDEAPVLQRLASGGPASVEDALSGAGLVALYRALADAHGEAATPEAVFARSHEDTAARKAVALFTRWLGRVAGDLALATASWGGVYLTGGLIRSWRPVGDLAAFRAAFEAKGKMRARMAAVPTVAITHEQVALLGLAHAEL